MNMVLLDCPMESVPADRHVLMKSNCGKSTVHCVHHRHSEDYGMEKHSLPTSVRRMECISVSGNVSDCSGSSGSACESHDLHLLTEILNRRRPSKKTKSTSCRSRHRCVDARRGALPTAWDILSDVDSTGDQRPGAFACADTEERRVLRSCPIARWQVCLEQRNGGV